MEWGRVRARLGCLSGLRILLVGQLDFIYLSPSHSLAKEMTSQLNGSQPTVVVVEPACLLSWPYSSGLRANETIQPERTGNRSALNYPPSLQSSRSGALLRVCRSAIELAIGEKEVNEFLMYACACFSVSPSLPLAALLKPPELGSLSKGRRRRRGELTCFINRLAWTSSIEQPVRKRGAMREGEKERASERLHWN